MLRGTALACCNITCAGMQAPSSHELVLLTDILRLQHLHSCNYSTVVQLQM